MGRSKGDGVGKGGVGGGGCVATVLHRQTGSGVSGNGGGGYGGVMDGMWVGRSGGI